MCGRVVIARNSRELARIAQIKQSQMKNSINYKESYNCSPGQYIPAVYYTSISPNQKILSLEAMKWGASVNTLPNILFNSRSDTINKYSFYSKFKRCVVLIDGYFEWKDKQPYYISNDKNEIVYLAAIYLDQIDSDGFDYKEVSIITKDACKDIAFIHHRMPVMLKSHEEVEEYLKGDKKIEEIIQEKDIKLTYYQVGDLVNKLSNVGKDNILRKEEIGYNKNKNLLIDSFVKKGVIDKNKSVLPPKINLNKINTLETIKTKVIKNDKDTVKSDESTQLGTVINDLSTLKKKYGKSNFKKGKRNNDYSYSKFGISSSSKKKSKSKFKSKSKSKSKERNSSLENKKNKSDNLSKSPILNFITLKSKSCTKDKTSK